MFVRPDGATVTGRRKIALMYAEGVALGERPRSAFKRGCGRAVSSSGEVLEWGDADVTRQSVGGKVAFPGSPYVTWRRRSADGKWRIVREVEFDRSPTNLPACLDATSHAFDEAQFARDSVAIGFFLEPDLIYVRGSGARTGVAAFLRAVGDKSVELDPFVIDDRSFIALGRDGAVVTASARVSGSQGGRPLTESFRYADSFRRVGGQWRVAFVQVTPSKT